MKGKHTKSSVKPAGSASRPHHLAVADFPPLALAALTQHTTSGQSTARSLFTELKVHPKYEYFYLE